MQGKGDLGLAKKGLGMDDSFLSMFLFCLLMLELIAAPAGACLDTDQTIGQNSCFLFYIHMQFL